MRNGLGDAVWLAGALWLATSASARAEAPVEVEARVEVSADGDCVASDALAAHVEEALTHEAPSPARVVVHVACGDPITAHVVVRAPDAETSRDLAVAQGERALLAEAVALGAVLALDELARQPHVAPVEATPRPTLATRLASPVRAPVVDAPPTPSSVGPGRAELALRAGVLVGIAPDPVAGVGVGGGYRWDDVFSVEVEGLGSFPGASSVGSGQVEVATLALRVGVCADAAVAPARLGGCVGAWGGSLSVRTDGFASGARSDWVGWGAVEGRLRATFGLDAFFVRLEAALLGVLVGPVLLVDAGRDPLVASQTGPVAGWGGLALGVSFTP